MSIEERINGILWDGAETDRVLIGIGAIESIFDVVKPYCGSNPIVVIADENTFEAAGRAVNDILLRKGPNLADPFVFHDENLHADYRYVTRLTSFLREKKAFPIAVGSGTINDLVKLASHECDRRYISVGTAASMDGYTAYGAAIIADGYKQTFSCPAPLAVVMDLDVVARAPSLMNAAGYGDLIAKIPAGADWLLAEVLEVEPVDRAAFDLVQVRLREWVSDPEGVKRGDPKALAGLVEGLIMTGLAMQKARSSRPASGADHQFSHLWDMQGHKHLGKTPFHGWKVGIGSVCSAAMYDGLLSSDLKEVGLNHVPWNVISDAVTSDFGSTPLADQVLVQCRSKYVDKEKLSARLAVLTEKWVEIREILEKQLMPAFELKDYLARAGAPSTPGEIGISNERLQRSFGQAKLIRSRYTILDLVLEADLWGCCVDSQFENNGIWAV